MGEFYLQVAIGNEPFHEDNRNLAMPHLLGAFNKMVQVLEQKGLQNKIKVTCLRLTISKHDARTFLTKWKSIVI